ncbi:hypothetical protein C8A01DRAFT_31916 [Parachaetomium inaequale]|uniref:Uncharacterized protein n=1 Tax=Parachaetomium inaequale TaxID=2588326 RepID=A0AAN6SUX5_9PEZI|nr:hypothetical protein C8A01DRAFT_31916 [Parachaetomium inaequale]
MSGQVEGWQQQRPIRGPKIEDEAPRRKKKSAKIEDKVPRQHKKSVDEKSLAPRAATAPRKHSRPAPKAGGSSNSNATLRRTGRTKPPATPRPDESPDEFQLRCALNSSYIRTRERERARFDKLASLLPVSVISRLDTAGGAPKSSPGGDPDGGSAMEGAPAVVRTLLRRGQRLDETRLSRKEILELSALYIGSMEKERERWEEEREELLEEIRRLREKCGEEMEEEMTDGL